MQVSYTDLATPEGVTAHMSAATSRADWNQKCNEVKAANSGNYPRFWYATIILGGVAGKTQAKW